MVRWWKISTPEQSESVNSFVAFFAIPFFTFGFTVHIDPFRANYRAIATDVVSKVVIAAIIGAWWVLFAQGRRNAIVNWSITGFSLSTLTSSLVVGVPMAQAMYGDWAQQLIVRSPSSRPSSGSRSSSSRSRSGRPPSGRRSAASLIVFMTSLLDLNLNLRRRDQAIRS
jgi:hypothetical protein